MKNKHNLNLMFRLTLIVIIAPIMYGCSKNLSRGQAEDIIIKHLNLPQSETAQFDVLYVEGDIPWNLTRISKEEENMLNSFSNKGLVNIKKIPHNTDIPGPMGGVIATQHWTTIKAELTNEGRKYLVQENKDKYTVKTCEITFGEVTGIQIQEQFKVAEVNYTLKREKITPFGINISQNPINCTATFSLFDDGWRIK